MKGFLIIVILATCIGCSDSNSPSARCDALSIELLEIWDELDENETELEEGSEYRRQRLIEQQTELLIREQEISARIDALGCAN